MKIGKVEEDHLTSEYLFRIEKEKKTNNYDLVYIFVSDSDFAVRKQLMSMGAKLVDQKVTYKKWIPEYQVNNILKIETFEGDVTPELLKLAISSGHKSRFYKDSRLSPHFIRLYSSWIEKSVSKELADEVLVSIHKDKLSGFVTLKKNEKEGSVGLIAVGKELRGMGIGKELLIAAENWFRGNNCNQISIVTQQENVPACILYEKSGYQLFSSQYVYHY